jgi:hypothetical protein
MAIITMFFAAHSGGEMVHGDDFPLKPAKVSSQK